MKITANQLFLALSIFIIVYWCFHLSLPDLVIETFTEEPLSEFEPISEFEPLPENVFPIIKIPNICKSSSDENEECKTHLDCQNEMFCIESVKKCSNKLEVGMKCTKNEECYSDSCLRADDDSKCCQTTERGVVECSDNCKCHPKFRIGRDCTKDEECMGNPSRCGPNPDNKMDPTKKICLQVTGWGNTCNPNVMKNCEEGTSCQRVEVPCQSDLGKVQLQKGIRDSCFGYRCIKPESSIGHLGEAKSNLECQYPYTTLAYRKNPTDDNREDIVFDPTPCLDDDPSTLCKKYCSDFSRRADSVYISSVPENADVVNLVSTDKQKMMCMKSQINDDGTSENYLLEEHPIRPIDYPLDLDNNGKPLLHHNSPECNWFNYSRLEADKCLTNVKYNKCPKDSINQELWLNNESNYNPIKNWYIESPQIEGYDVFGNTTFNTAQNIDSVFDTHDGTLQECANQCNNSEVYPNCRGITYGSHDKYCQGWSINHKDSEAKAKSSSYYNYYGKTDHDPLQSLHPPNYKMVPQKRINSDDPNPNIFTKNPPDATPIECADACNNNPTTCKSFIFGIAGADKGKCFAKKINTKDHDLNSILLDDSNFNYYEKV